MRRKQLAAFLLLMAALTGCGGVENTKESPVGKTAEAEEQEPNAGEITSAEDTREADMAREQEEALQENVLPDGICQGRMFLEDEEAFYFCSTEQIRRTEKQGGATRVLWERDEDRHADDSYLFIEGYALLLGNHIYFLEEGDWEPDGGRGRGLSVIGTDGTGYRRMAELEDYPLAFYFYDGGLCLESNGSAVRYPVAEDGSPVPDGAPQEIPFKNIPEGYHLVNVRHGAGRYLSMRESLDIFGYYLLENQDMELIAVNPENGEERKIAQSYLRALNREYFLFMDYTQQGEELRLMKANPPGEEEEMRLLTSYNGEDYPSGVMALDMDDSYVYVVVENSKGGPDQESIYEKIDLETGERKELFRLGRQLGMEGSYPFYARNVVFGEDYACYVDARDYKMYLMRRSLEEPEKVEILGDALYDSGIGQVGSVEGYYKQIYSQVRPDFVLTEIDLQRLLVDERYEGAAKINQMLKEYQDAIIRYEEDEEDINWREEELASLEEELTPWSLQYSYSSYPSEISYFDGDVFSFRQMDYDYTGGAHGMPFWEGYTFDLHTGERLLLSDVIGNSEQELKEIVVRYFEAYMAGEENNFWDDALTVVRDGTGLSSQFYLAEDGIRFYFEPYVLSSYAAGFQQVTIPFEEFEMKILCGQT